MSFQMINDIRRLACSGELRLAPIVARVFACAGAALALASLAAPPAAEARPKPENAPGKLSSEASLRVARALRNSGDAAASLPIYRELTKGLAPDAPLRVELGDAMLDARLIDDAIGVYSAAAGAPRAQLGLARAQLVLGQPVRALPFAQRAVELAPTDAAALTMQGVVLDRLGRHAEAQASYRAVLAKSPQSVAARTDLALSLALTGQFAEALDILEPIARSANASPRDRQNLAFIYGLKGDDAAARSLGEVDLDPKTAAANAEFLAMARERLPGARP